jgi:DNA-binding NarL/FixJ family response regulator
MKHRVFLVEDHPVMREGLALLINYQRDLEVCGQADSVPTALAQVPQARPDVLVVDISLGDGGSGLELLKDLARLHPELPALVLSSHDEALYAERALRAGARGYVMKQAETERVLEGIRTLLRGDIYASDAIRRRLMQRAIRGEAPVVGGSDIDQLSDRELEVFRLLGHGRGTKQIAADLSISVSTVETYRAHLKTKLNLTNSSELVRRAVEWVQENGG